MNLHPHTPDQEPKPWHFLAIIAAAGIAWLVVGLYLVQIGAIA